MDIVRQGEILGDAFDRVILYEDQCNRGRPDGETIALLASGVRSGSRVKDLTETRGELHAIGMALKDLNPGDLMVIQPDQVEETLAFVERHLASIPATGDDDLPTMDTSDELESAVAAALSSEAGRVILQG